LVRALEEEDIHRLGSGMAGLEAVDAKDLVDLAAEALDYAAVREDMGSGSGGGWSGSFRFQPVKV
jgi:hypothetical protein